MQSKIPVKLRYSFAFRNLNQKKKEKKAAFLWIQTWWRLNGVLAAEATLIYTGWWWNIISILKTSTHDCKLTSNSILPGWAINHIALIQDHAYISATHKTRVKPVGILSTFIGKQITVQQTRMFQLLTVHSGQRGMFLKEWNWGMNRVQVQYVGVGVGELWDDSTSPVEPSRLRAREGKCEARVDCRLLREPERLSRASWRHSWCRWPARLLWTTGRSPSWHSPQSRCRGWCSCRGRGEWGWGWGGWARVGRLSEQKPVDTHLPTSMQKSPLMVPGRELAGLVSPSITRPVFTAPLPSHTWTTEGGGVRHAALRSSKSFSLRATNSQTASVLTTRQRLLKKTTVCNSSPSKWPHTHYITISICAAVMMYMCTIH